MPQKSYEDLSGALRIFFETLQSDMKTKLAPNVLGSVGA